ncbi:two component transcriptional regulator, LytTR family [Flavobacterium fontis]|uniref:Two component transcriptional regulator, LytTR family n=1 Tax=Flavobacterium fontis TaxID=1124188 RepID=A0A1M4WVM0_9FLAO|nr:LytTR family DNA-binding domain-containing protein [Flavobacterium fontis]SHE85260.1 two component transcriptional regulator, LytTR family [Flavobacterium fontis]
MPRYRCIIVDDDEIDRLTVWSYAQKQESLEIVGMYSSAQEILSQGIDFSTLDIAFLDIDMPGMSGLHLRQFLQEIPVCVFISAHPEYAAETFALETLDFIVKPLKAERFQQTMVRIEQYLTLREKASYLDKTLGTDQIVIKEGHTESKIQLNEILYLEALKDYTLIITPHKRHCVLASIGNLLKESHFQSFVRIHRSYAVQRSVVKHKKPQEIELENGVTIPIGRSYKEIAMQLL